MLSANRQVSISLTCQGNRLLIADILSSKIQNIVLNVGIQHYSNYKQVKTLGTGNDYYLWMDVYHQGVYTIIIRLSVTYNNVYFL